MTSLRASLSIGCSFRSHVAFSHDFSLGQTFSMALPSLPTHASMSFAGFASGATLDG